MKKRFNWLANRFLLMTSIVAHPCLSGRSCLPVKYFKNILILEKRIIFWLYNWEDVPCMNPYSCAAGERQFFQ